MMKTIDKTRSLSEQREIEDRFNQIILACGVCSLQEKVSILIDTINYIFEHNKELIPVFCDEVTIH